MNEKRFWELNKSDLSKHMVLFKDMYEDEAEAAMRSMCRSGYARTVEQDKDYLEEYLQSAPDAIWTRDFVEIEMNQSLSDPTGQAHLLWLQEVLSRMKTVLAEEKTRAKG